MYNKDPACAAVIAAKVLTGLRVYVFCLRFFSPCFAFFYM